MTNSGELRVSSRGQMSLPAVTRTRWGIQGGGDVGYLDLGEAVLIIPGGAKALRHKLLDALNETDWDNAREGFGDHDLANQ